MPKLNGKSDEPLQVELNERNLATAFANLDALREDFAAIMRKIAGMEAEIATTRSLVQKQAQFIGEQMQVRMGHGSTVRE